MAFATPFKGWSVNILPVRSTAVALPLMWARDYALSRHRCWCLRNQFRCECRLFRQSFHSLEGRHFADAKGGRDLSGRRSLEEVLEVTVLAEDIGESLLDDIIGAGADERCILIDLSCGRMGQPDRCTDLTGLDSFE